ncbi:hypothetical protein V1514DRAFT_350321 [Lipomyces japonicus]|uniref:uncharacterized protein n=1 Tax=Lipomyces japonicus TaxID=56871 RepID=UPI0034CD6C9C
MDHHHIEPLTTPVVPYARPPPHIWLITDLASALGRQLATQALAKGHRIAGGCKPELAVADTSETLTQLKHEFGGLGGDTVIIEELDITNKPLCQSFVAGVIAEWGRIDVLVCCSALSIVGAIEEASEWHIREQFETSFYGPVNMITTILPIMRKQRSGHIITVTGITGQMGTPSLGLLSSASHAIEGYCEALAFEIAPYGIKVTIAEPTLEATVLANPIIFTKQLEPYRKGICAQVRTMLTCSDLAHELLVKDTAFAIISIAGVANPPGRIVAGAEAIEQTRDKLRTVSEEMEDMLEVSFAADAVPLSDRERRELAGE